MKNKRTLLCFVIYRKYITDPFDIEGKNRVRGATYQYMAGETYGDNEANFGPSLQAESPEKAEFPISIKQASIQITQILLVCKNEKLYEGKIYCHTWRHTEQETFSPEASTLLSLVIVIFGIFSTESPGKPFALPVSNMFGASSYVASTAPI